MTRHVSQLALAGMAATLLLSACGGAADDTPTPADGAVGTPTTTATTPEAEDGDALPLHERDANGAQRVVRTAIDLLKRGQLADLAQLVAPEDDARRNIEAIDSKRDAYPNADATVGEPGVIEGAAGSLYVQVPVTVYPGGLDQVADHRRAIVTLRRVNDVPGSSEEERSWRIVDLETVTPPAGER